MIYETDLCVVEEYGPVLLAVLGPDDGVALHGEVVQAVVVGVVVHYLALLTHGSAARGKHFFFVDLFMLRVPSCISPWIENR